jgi:hypothetical protein
MKKSPLVLAIAILLFAGWLTFLGIEAMRNRNPMVVSRSQLTLSQYDIEADLDSGSAGLPTRITVHSVRWSVDGAKPSGEINVLNLPSVQGYVGPGRYFLPLVRKGNDYEVAKTPGSLDPGFLPRESIPPRIYPDTPEVQRQWNEIRGTP